MPTPDFDSVAWFYDPLARLVFGRTLLAAQRAALRHGLPAGATRVLFIGGGTGQVLPELLMLRPEARVYYLEASARMLRRAERTLAATLPAARGRVTFRHGTEADLPPGAEFDAVVAFFLFDLFTPPELGALLDRLRPHTHPGTCWLVADFAPPRRGWQRGLQWLMYRFFRRTSGVSGRQLPDIPAALRQLPLQPQWRQQWGRGLVEASVWGRFPAADAG